MDMRAFHFVRVTTDDRSCQLWAAATAREDAVDRVLDIIPEGWCARLIDEEAAHMDLSHLDLHLVHAILSKLAQGDVRALNGISDAA